MGVPWGVFDPPWCLVVVVGQGPRGEFFKIENQSKHGWESPGVFLTPHPMVSGSELGALSAGV